ncbi:MAG: Omp28 family outer membrane lipoprotein [Bacteroidetes bacterium]|nr:Omp28 family outer membrane lipoprotein [Bacteroidota bacterium]
MKKLIYIIPTTAIAMLFILFACDKVTHPYISSSTTTGTTTTGTTTLVRKALVEDYTGHQCGNCPAAAIVASQLEQQYDTNIVVIAVHTGFFAGVNAQYPISYTTTVGNDWASTAGFNILSFPTGMVNRKNYDGSGVLQSQGKWPSFVTSAFADNYYLSLSVAPNYTISSRIMNPVIKAKFKNAYANSVKLNVVITEDSIIGPQKDYTKSPDLVPSYVFNHMLRDALNGSWGNTLKSAPINVNDTASVTLNYTLNSSFNDKQIHLIAYVYDATTLEVIQVQSVKIR